jgi:hypothetical protein
VSPSTRGTDFLRVALGLKGGGTSVVAARVVGLKEFTRDALVAPGRPRVLVLCNVPRLDTEQQELVRQFLAEGGGVLVTLGERVEAEAYNGQLYRGGEGWLPALLEGIEGEESRVADAARPDPATFTHPTLELFGKVRVGGLGQARFPRWWKLTTPGKHAPGVPVGLLRSGAASYPFFVERAYQAGRVLLSAVPLDNSWATNLPDLPDFVPLAHELIYYLAGARGAEFNLRPGQPLRYRVESLKEGAPEEEVVSQFALRPPVGEERPLSTNPTRPGTYLAQLTRQERGAVLAHDGARETGVYRLTTPADPESQAPAGRTVYYVVQPDARESDLTPCSEEDRRRVADLVPLTYESDRGAIVQAREGSSQRQELWLYLLLGLIGLLCAEVWMTRRLVRSRA